MGRTRALGHYVVAVLILWGGAATAMAKHPGGFDWAYTVISRLASLKHNPDGGVWLAGALLPAMVVLWPVTGYLQSRVKDAAKAVFALRAGIIGGALLGLEGLLQLELSGLHRKAHEILALVTFAGLYGGVLGLYYRRMRQQATFLVPALLVVLPLLAVCATQLALYFGQRDLGWVSTNWRELGVPVWLSFAFWQWTAVAMLWSGLGHLLLTAPQACAVPESAPNTPAGERAAARTASPPVGVSAG